jgi:hypothetical protein
MMRYHRARYYHPGLRRFLNQDVVLGATSTPTSLNRFAYANGNPVSGIDPFGLFDSSTTTASIPAVIVGVKIVAGASGVTIAGTVVAVAGTAAAIVYDAKMAVDISNANAIGSKALDNAIRLEAANRELAKRREDPELPDEYKPKPRERQPDKMGGEDTDPFWWEKDPAKREKLRRDLEDSKRGTGRGGGDNIDRPDDPDNWGFIPPIPIFLPKDKKKECQ